MCFNIPVPCQFVSYRQTSKEWCFITVTLLLISIWIYSYVYPIEEYRHMVFTLFVYSHGLVIQSASNSVQVNDKSQRWWNLNSHRSWIWGGSSSCLSLTFMYFNIHNSERVISAMLNQSLLAKERSTYVEYVRLIIFTTLALHLIHIWIHTHIHADLKLRLLTNVCKEHHLWNIYEFYLCIC